MSMQLVKYIAQDVCGAEVSVQRTSFDLNSYLIQPCDQTQFTRIVEAVKGGGQFIQPLSSIGSYQDGKALICNVGITKLAIACPVCDGDGREHDTSLHQPACLCQSCAGDIQPCKFCHGTGLNLKAESIC